MKISLWKMVVLICFVILFIVFPASAFGCDGVQASASVGRAVVSGGDYCAPAASAAVVRAPAMVYQQAAPVVVQQAPVVVQQAPQMVYAQPAQAVVSYAPAMAVVRSRAVVDYGASASFAVRAPVRVRAVIDEPVVVGGKGRRGKTKSKAKSVVRSR